MIGEQKYIEKQEEIAFKQSQEDYGHKQTEAQLLEHEKQVLKKRLLQIQQEENKIDPKKIEMKKTRLHFAVARHRQQKAVSNQLIKNSFLAQETHTDFKTGKIIIGVE